MADQRRFNPPPGGTSQPTFSAFHPEPRNRTRSPTQPRKIFLKTGIVPSASGSAYLEQSPCAPSTSSSPNPTSQLQPSTSFASPSPSLKLIVTVHGPRPLPRTSPFSSTLVLTTHLKYAPFASRARRGYIRDPTERDLGAHLDTALRGVVIGERWPKSAVEVVVTVLEAEDEDAAAERMESGSWGSGLKGLGAMNVLAGAITASSAALVDAGVDCVDLVSGGVAARTGETEVVDPAVGEGRVDAACVVGYLQARDEVTEVWAKGDVGAGYEGLVDRAVEAAVLVRGLLAETLKEATAQKLLLLERKAKEEAGKMRERVEAKEVDMQ